MNLRVTGKDKDGHINFEQVLDLPADLLYEIKIGKRTIFTQFKMSNKEVLSALIEEMREWDITCEQKDSYMIFKKGDKVHELLDITNSIEQPCLDPVFYKKILADSILKTLL